MRAKRARKEFPGILGPAERYVQYSTFFYFFQVTRDVDFMSHNIVTSFVADICVTMLLEIRVRVPQWHHIHCHRRMSCMRVSQRKAGGPGKHFFLGPPFVGNIEVLWDKGEDSGKRPSGVRGHERDNQHWHEDISTVCCGIIYNISQIQNNEWMNEQINDDISIHFLPPFLRTFLASIAS